MGSRRTGTTLKETDTTEQPIIWNTTAPTIPVYLMTKGREIDQDTNYRTLVERRTVMHRGRTCVLSPTHARLLHRDGGLLRPTSTSTNPHPKAYGTRNPAPRSIADDIDLVPRIPPPAERTPHSAASAPPTAPSAPSSPAVVVSPAPSAAPAAAPSAAPPPHTPAAPKDPYWLTHLTDEESQRYWVNPEYIAHVDSDLLSEYFDGFKRFALEVQRWRSKCDNSGAVFIKLMWDKAQASISHEHQLDLSDKLQKLVEGGLDAATVEDLNLWHEKYYNFNEQFPPLSGFYQEPNTVASRIVTVVRSLGDFMVHHFFAATRPYRFEPV